MNPSTFSTKHEGEIRTRATVETSLPRSFFSFFEDAKKLFPPPTHFMLSCLVPEPARECTNNRWKNLSEAQENPMEKANDILDSYLEMAKRQQEAITEALANLIIKLKPFYENTGFISQRLQELYFQYKTAFTEGISNFEPPETYNPTETKLHPWAEELARREGFDLLEQLETGTFSFMLDRYRKGFEAYLQEEYQLATFTFISMIDGMIRRFYEMHKGIDVLCSKKHPTFENGLNHLEMHYKMDVFVGKPEFKIRLRAFFEHRNEIMHGGQYSYFDKNTSSIALLFLIVTYGSISSVDQPK